MTAMSRMLTDFAALQRAHYKDRQRLSIQWSYESNNVLTNTYGRKHETDTSTISKVTN
jgi:hypothetical protein